MPDYTKLIINDIGLVQVTALLDLLEGAPPRAVWLQLLDQTLGPVEAAAMRHARANDGWVTTHDLRASDGFADKSLSRLSGLLDQLAMKGLLVKIGEERIPEGGRRHIYVVWDHSDA